MGKTIANLNREEISEFFSEKLAEYFLIMKEVISEDELVAKTEYIMPELGFLIGSYYALKNNNDTKTILESEKSLESLENELNELMNNEFKLLNYITRSKNSNTSGVECIVGDKKLFTGLNKQIGERVLRTLQFEKEKNGEDFEFSSGDNEGFLIQTKDSVVVELNEPNLFNMFFNGNGEGFYKSLKDRGLTDKEIILLSGMIDLSVNNDDESYTREYESLMKKLNDSMNKTIEQPSINNESSIVVEYAPPTELPPIPTGDIKPKHL